MNSRLEKVRKLKLDVSERAPAVARRWTFWLLLVVVSAGGAFLALKNTPPRNSVSPTSEASIPSPAAASPSSASAAPTQPPPMNRFTAAGYVEPMPPFPIHVSPLVIGRIDEFTITEGQPVEAGQIIAKLNPEEFEKRLAELKATLSVNAGEPLPFERLEDLPANLRPLVVTGDPEAEENEPSGAFELNTLYQMTSDGRLGRKLQREVASHFEEAFVYGLGTSKCDARLRTSVSRIPRIAWHFYQKSRTLGLCGDT